MLLLLVVIRGLIVCSFQFVDQKDSVEPFLAGSSLSLGMSSGFSGKQIESVWEPLRNMLLSSSRLVINHHHNHNRHHQFQLVVMGTNELSLLFQSFVMTTDQCFYHSWHLTSLRTSTESASEQILEVVLCKYSITLHYSLVCLRLYFPKFFSAIVPLIGCFYGF